MSGHIVTLLQQAAQKAIQEALGVDAPADLRETNDPRFGDYQINGVLPLAKQLRDNPRKLAAKVVEVLDTEGACGEPEIAGTGFINLRLNPDWLGAHLGQVAGDDRLGVAPVAEPQRIVVDFSSPNVAKKMHVGHLRSTCIGDAIVRTLRWVGHDVIGDNHVGDWGTQFGILIWAWRHHGDEAAMAADGIGELERLYRLGNAAQREDDAIAQACRDELVKLQGGDADNLALWQRFVDVSRAEAQRLYDRLNVSFDTWKGESYFNEALAPLVARLESEGIAERSEGALVVFNEGQNPYLVQKRDGGFLYSTTDLATIEHRIAEHQTERMIYVVDVRQSQHFRQLFATAQRMGVSGVQFDHVGFGMMLGPDGTPFKTRDGGTVSLQALLDEATERVLPQVQERYPDADDATQRALAEEIGVGAVKYADLSPNLTTDYKFEWEKLTAADGNTGPYLQYSYVRTRAIARKYAEQHGQAFVPSDAPLVLEAPQELALAKHLTKLQDVLEAVAADLRPHMLCEYLYSLSREFSRFYQGCPVLKSEGDELRSRMTLVHMTERALTIGMQCLNLPLPQKM